MSVILCAATTVPPPTTTNTPTATQLSQARGAPRRPQWKGSTGGDLMYIL